MSNYVQTMRKKIGHDRLMFVGAGVFIHRDGRILLQKRTDNGYWADHGGSIEIGETLEDAARREVLEETGLQLGKLDFLTIQSGPQMLYTYPNGDEAYIIAAYYVCEDFTGTPHPADGEAAELRWFTREDAPSPDEINPTSRPAYGAFLRYLGW